MAICGLGHADGLLDRWMLEDEVLAGPLTTRHSKFIPS